MSSVRAPSNSEAVGSVDGPRRVQFSRAKGWRMPPNTVKVDRSTPYGNPWKIVGPNEYRRLWWVQGPRADQECSSEDEAVALSLRKFRFYAEHRPELFRDLRGKNLGCWCKIGSPCHADVLLELANVPVEPSPPSDGRRASTESSAGVVE